jgi:TDG/mug DNA glycosylase family protein
VAEDPRATAGSPGPRPTAADLEAARDATIPDVLAGGLRVVFAGINPGLYSAATGHHFARPGNRFWPALHRSGFTPRQFRPDEQDQLRALGLGITNGAPRATARAAELTPAELREGALALQEKMARLRPQWLAVLGVTVYRTAFGHPDAVVGPQAAGIGPTRLWVLPNPSGLNAHWTPTALAGEFARLRAQVISPSGPGGPDGAWAPAPAG